MSITLKKTEMKLSFISTKHETRVATKIWWDQKWGQVAVKNFCSSLKSIQSAQEITSLPASAFRPTLAPPLVGRAL